MVEYSSEKSGLLIPEDRDQIIGFIRDYFNRAGISEAVVGISGGIDSAVIAHLCAIALSADHVHGVLMPHRISNPSSLEDGEKVISQLQCHRREVDISMMSDAYIDQFEIQDPLRKGNIYARVRMIVLYDISAEVNGLVVGTGNKTEIYLGYSTQHGDAACALAPIGDLYKTQVRALAKDLGIHPDIISKAPSADLWEGQTDEDELGITYEEADAILTSHFDKGMKTYEMIKDGFEPDSVNRVLELVDRNEFKRKLPPMCILDRK